MARTGGTERNDRVGDTPRRARRLAWLASVRATLDGIAPLIDQAGTLGIDTADLRARLAVALTATRVCDDELGEAIDAASLESVLQAQPGNGHVRGTMFDMATGRPIPMPGLASSQAGEPGVKVRPSWSSSDPEAER